MSTRPNVLFVITDQHRADHVGFMGNEVVRTPNLDALAARGTVFDNMWVANPVCMPNRSSIVTGRMPSAHGVIFNDRSLDWNVATHIRQFRESGWRTGLFGKSHLQHGMSRNSVMAGNLRPVATPIHPDGWNNLEHEELYLDGEPDWPDDFYGFGRVELAIDHGAKVSGHHLRWALERGAKYEDLVVPYSNESPATRRSDRWWQVYQPPYGPEFHSTSFVVDRTIDFINDAAGADEPWLAWASFPDPHHPMSPPGEWFDKYDPNDIELPASLNDPLDHAPAYLRHVQQAHPSEQRMWVSPCGATDHELVREATAATYGMVEFIDHGVGQIVSALDQAGQLDNTIIVFTSDHGDMMGDHGLMLKGFMPFRGTQQVSLVIVDPRPESELAPARTSALASSIDLGSTLMDMCDVPTYDGVQGQSLLPVLQDPQTSVRDHILIEDDLRRMTGMQLRIPHRIRSIVTDDRLKYTRFSTGESMLFDLENDPLEVEEIGTTRPDAFVRANERLVDAMMDASDDARGAPRDPEESPMASSVG